MFMYKIRIITVHLNCRLEKCANVLSRVVMYEYEEKKSTCKGSGDEREQVIIVVCRVRQNVTQFAIYKFVLNCWHLLYIFNKSLLLFLNNTAITKEFLLF